MTIWDLPWIEFALVAPWIGALFVNRLRDPIVAYQAGLAFSGVCLACTALAWLDPGLGAPPSPDALSLQLFLFGKRLFAVDQFSAVLVVLVALLHFLTALATGRTKMRRFSMTFSLLSETLQLAMFSSTEAWLLIGLLAVATVPAYFELVNRGRSTSVYVLHMALYLGLLVLGWAFVDPGRGPEEQSPWAASCLLAAILIRCGTIPAHCWMTDWFENASFGNALLFVTPLTGVYAAVRLVLPVAPDWVLTSIGVFSSLTAVYAACMASTQQDTRRFFVYLFLSHASLVLVGLELHTSVSLTGALSLWLSASLSLAGFGLTLRALEARYGRLSLASFHGLYQQSPALAVCFALTGLGSVGFPGTLGFVATEMVIDGAVEASPFVGLAVVLAAAVNGIAVVRAYFMLFTGARHASTVSLKVGLRERLAVLTLAGLILGGGLFPQPGISSRYRAAVLILQSRDSFKNGTPKEAKHVGNRDLKEKAVGVADGAVE